MRVAEGQVPALARLDAEREADEAVGRAHRMLVVGQQLEAEAPGRLHRLDDLAEALGRGHDLVVASAGDRTRGLRAAAVRVVRVLRQPPDERAELELLEQGEHGRTVVVVHQRRVEVQGDVRHVGDDGGHALVVPGVLDGRGQRLLGARRLDLVEVLDHALERAPLADQRLRALVADAADAGDVVGVVADEGLEVRDLLGLEAPAVTHPLRVVQDIISLIRPVHQHLHARLDELHHVVVECHDDGLDARRLRLRGERAEDVVGLVARRLDQGNPERAQHIAHPLDLRLQVVGRRRAGRLVVRVGLVAEGGRRGVPGGDDVRRPQLVEDVEQRVRVAVDGPDRLAGAPHGAREAVAQRVVRAIDDAVRIEDDEQVRAVRQIEGHCPQYIAALGGRG